MKRSQILNSILVFAASLMCSAVSLAQQTDISKTDSIHDMRIRLQAYTFDPLKQMPAIDRNLLLKEVPGESVYRLVQFKGPLTRKQMELLMTRYGLSLDNYIPNFTYLEKVNPSQLESLQGLSFFRWAGNYEPAYKISPGIGLRSGGDTIDRRINEKIIVLHHDADVQSVKEQLDAMEIKILNVWDDRKLNIKRIKIDLVDLSMIEKIAQIPEVKWIEEFGQMNLRNQSASWIVQTNITNSRIINDRGLRGENQIIGHIDGAIDIDHCFFQDPVNNTPNPNHRKVVAYHSSTGIPPTFDEHGTHTAGTAAGQDLISTGAINDQRRGEDGHAFRARLSHTINGDITGSGTVASNLRAAFEDMYSDGARVYTNSWGDDGTTAYTTWCEDIDQFAWDHEDVLVVFACSNLTSLKTPENAKNCLAVDQSGDNPNQNNSDGGNGPTSDGRRKPEITAPGIGILSADANTAIDCGTRPSSGTSMATPAVAACGSIMRQYYMEGWYPSGTKQPHHSFIPSGALIKATLLNSTVDMTGTDDTGTALTGYPNNMEGWGRLLMENALYFQGDARNLTVWDVRHSNGLSTGLSNNYNVNVVGTAQPLKITLVWTEPPASTSSATASVNDIDLVVTAPNGDVYRGNDFTNGQSTVNGTVSDNLNNVEMVLVNGPQVGQYTIQVIGTAVNTGNPGQGYGLVVTADTEDPPAPTGTQNTLIVRTGLSDILAGTKPSETTVMNLMTAAGNYISEVSYGATTINPQYVETTLSQPSSFYYHPSRNVLIEMAQEVITNLVTADPDIFTQGTPATNDDIARLVILTNDPNFIGDWATTGEWPYDLPAGLTRRISVSVNSVHNDAEKRIEHALCHQFGLVDLYAYPNVIFAQPHVDDWDIMANILNNVHPMVWSKERAVWMTTHDPNSILFIPRPAPGSSDNRTVSLDLLSSTGTTNRKAVAIGLTPNVTNIANEQVFYFIEARSNSGTDKDSNVPEPGVLLYYVNENIRQGEGPVRIIDDVVSTTTLTDAALEVGDAKTPGGTGLTVTVQTGTGGAAYDVNISYSPPLTDNDVNIITGDPAWESPDIWVDSPKNGFDVESGRIPADRGDDPVVNEVNRIYFKIHNPGPGNANDITVHVRVSEPYHTVGGVQDFNVVVGQKYYSLFSAGTDITDFVEWTPDNDGDPHSCIWVEIPNVFNDVNTYNNYAQQNTNEVQSSHSSPYETVVYHFGVSNPYDFPQLMYFRTEGLPQGWTEILNPSSALLNAHQRLDGTLSVHPPDDAVPCTEHRIILTSWMPVGNTLVKLGGGILQVDLRNRTDITLEENVGICDDKRRSSDNNLRGVMAAGLHFVLPDCIFISIKGCTNPPRPDEEIIVRYEDPDGNPVYHTIMTDEYGCYSDTYIVAKGGDWNISVEYPGSDCSGSTSADGSVFVPINPTRELNIYAGYFQFNDRQPVKSNFTLGLRFGYNFAYLLGVEGEIGFTPTKDKSNVSGTVINANVNVLKYAVTGNLRFWPYAVASAGTVWLKGFTNSTSYVTTGVGLGAKYYFSNHFALRAETKLLYFQNLVNQQYTIGLSYRF